MIYYPSSLPCVSRTEHGATAYAGLVRTPMEAGNTRQRRAHRVLPHRITLAWDMPQEALATWVTWANAHAWDEFFLLALPGLTASREGTHTATVAVRFISDLSQELLPGRGLWYWRLSVEAEWLPTSGDLVQIPLAVGWIDAGTPAAPSSDWIIAGTPAAPSPNWIVSQG